MLFKKKLEIYGDSIMRGVTLDRKTKRYCLFKDHFDSFEAEFPIEIINKSRFGCTIDKGYKFLESDINNGLKCDMVLLEYGGNDCDFKWSDIANDPYKLHLPNTPLEKFVTTLKNMIFRIKSTGITPIIMSLPPIDAEKYFNWFTKDGLNKEAILYWLGDIQTIYRQQELYSLEATKIAYETNCVFIDVRSAFLDKHNYKDLLCEDGIHPNREGHQLIAGVFARFTKSKLAKI